MELKTCTKCGLEQPINDFSQEMKRGKRIRRAQCSACRKAAGSITQKARYQTRRAALGALKEVPCADCRKQYKSHVMDFDHLDRVTKVADVGVLLVTSSWEEVLAEVAKCDVVCANCHRLRTWAPSRGTGRKRALLRRLKDVPCADCGGSFQYSQMDFDHARGTKVGAVASLTGKSLRELLAEVAKCDVVCANCHRERTHCRKIHGTVDVLEAPESPNLPSWATKHNWHDLAGTMDDQAVAAIAGVTRGDVFAYRKAMRTPSYRKRPGAPWQHLVGTMPDTEVALIGKVTKGAVGHYRRRMGVPVFTQDQRAA